MTNFGAVFIGLSFIFIGLCWTLKEEPQLSCTLAGDYGTLIVGEK